MYEFILTHKLLTAVAALGLALLASTVAGNARLWWRGIAYSYMSALAAGFFLVAPLAHDAPNLADIVAGLLFETVGLCLFFVLFTRLYRTLAAAGDSDVRRLLRASLLLQVLAAWPLVTAEGFGLFSEGSRIEYLGGSAAAKYLTYLGVLVMSIQAPLIAHRISTTGGPGPSGLLAIGLAFALSVVAGSKGGAVLWLVAILSLVNYRRARISGLRISVALGAVGSLVLGSSAIIADFLGIELRDFIELASSRFFLNNDARALAFDQRHAVAAMDGSLLAESFRSLATLFGVPPSNAPIGLVLYEDLLGMDTGNGANASLMALAVYYSPSGHALLPAVAAVLAALLLTGFFAAAERLLRGATSRASLLALALVALQQFSQDFLAFQVVMPLILVTFVALWLYDLRHYRPVRASRRLAADPQHRHSSA